MFDATRMRGGEVSPVKGDGGDGVRKDEPIKRFGRAKASSNAGQKPLPADRRSAQAGRARSTRWMGTAKESLRRACCIRFGGACQAPHLKQRARRRTVCGSLPGRTDLENTGAGTPGRGVYR